MIRPKKKYFYDILKAFLKIGSYKSVKFTKKKMKCFQKREGATMAQGKNKILFFCEKIRLLSTFSQRYLMSFYIFLLQNLTFSYNQAYRGKLRTGK